MKRKRQTKFSFKGARRRQSILRDAVTDQNVSVAEDVWRGVTGSGEGGIVSVAVADTTPKEYATLCATDEIAAAFATATLLRWFGVCTKPANAWEARRIAHQGWAEFRQMAENASKRASDIGADMSHAWPLFKQVQDGKVNAAKLKQINDMAGRMQKMLKGTKAKRVEDIPEDIIGIRTGNDIGALIPQEIALAATPTTLYELALRLTERRALQYDRAGVDKKGRGPIVAVLDQSGSMECQGRDVLSMAAFTCLTNLSWEEKRPVKVVLFSTATKRFDLPVRDFKTLARVQCTFLNGGTDIGCALDAAADEVNDWATQGVKGADAVLISDGGDAGGRIRAALDSMERNGTRLFSIAIDESFKGDLRTRAAEYVHITESDLASGGGEAAFAKGIKGAVT